MARDTLTDMQRRFVLEFTSGEGAIGNATQAARRAGYSEKSAHEIGRQTLDKPHVRAAIDDALRAQISGPMAAKATAYLERAIDDERLPARVRLDAAKTILDRGGLVPARSNEEAQASRLRKPLSEMTVDELDALIAEGEARMAGTRDERSFDA